jgi:hypothetical protein
MKKSNLAFILAILVLTNGLTAYFTIRNTLVKSEVIIFDAKKKITLEGKDLFNADEVQIVLFKVFQKVYKSQGLYQGKHIAYLSVFFSFSIFFYGIYLQSNQGQARK